MTCLIILVIVLFAKTTDGNLFDGKSFSLRSSITAYPRSGGYSEIHLHESYSIEQQRAKLSFELNSFQVQQQLKTNLNSGVFYLDENNALSLLVDTSNSLKSECISSSIAELNMMLELNSFESIRIDNSLIIGTAKLLSLIDKNRSQIQVSKMYGNIDIRNYKCSVYVFIYTTEKETLNFTLFYSQDSNWLDMQPIQVMIEFPRDSRLSTIMIDYYQIEELNHEKKLSQLDTVEQIFHDEFMFRSECSLALVDNEKSILSTKSPFTTKFSFQSEFEHFGDFKGQLAISYDSNSDSMVIDPIAGVDTRTILNFKHNRMYQMNKKQLVESESNGNIQDHCIVSKILPFLPNKPKPLSIGQILIGADTFVYMGLAKVRGIDALVYSKASGSVPFWLEQPVVYREHEGGTSKLRNPDLGINLESEKRLYTVLYVADRDDKPLLLIELYQIDSITLKVLQKSRIFLYDFVWDLNKQIENGNRAAELFSLEDSCSLENALDQHTQFSLVLESEDSDPQKSEILNNPPARNLALLAGLQDTFDLPITMIYDMDSKVVNTTIESKPTTHQIETSFRMAEHIDTMIELEYLGHGNLKNSLGDARLKRVNSFQECLFKASLSQQISFFGYHHKIRLCTLMRPNPDVDTSTLEPKQVLNPSGRAEIFKVTHSTDLSMHKSSNWVETVYESRGITPFIGNRLKLLDSNQSILYVLKNIKIDSLQRDNFIEIEDKDSGQKEMVAKNKIKNIGLLETETGNRLITTNDIYAMTYEHCHSACLASLVCRSFSICILKGELQCIISNTSFKSESVLNRLISKSKNARRGQKISVQVEDQSQPVELYYHPNCELHNLMFLEMFKPPVFSINSFNNRQVYAVSSAEDCAEICLRENIETLIEDVTPNSYDSSKKSDKNDDAETRLRNMLSKHKNATSRIHRSFYYLGGSNLNNLSPNSRKIIESFAIPSGSVNEKVEKNYCILDRGTNPEKTIQQNIIESCDAYNLRFELFYEKQYGSKLRGSYLNVEETRAHDLLISIDNYHDFNKSAYSTIEHLVMNGSNFMSIVNGDASTCAKACFLQSAGPWPTCSSFDLIIIPQSRWYYCQLNSITMRQAVSSKKSDLIENMANAQIWHYEPRSGFVRDESVYQMELSMAEARLGSLLNSTRTLRINAIIIVILAFIGGSLIGVITGRRIIDRIGKGTSPEVDIPISQLSEIRFANLVNQD